MNGAPSRDTLEGEEYHEVALTEVPSEFEIDPLGDSDSEQRAKLAAIRTARTDVGIPGMEDQVSGRAPVKRVNSSYQRYLFGSAGSTGKPTWSDSMAGRAGIRIISRGIVGSLFFALGGKYAKQQLEGYEPQQWDRSKPLQWVAKGFDATLGTAIKYGVEAVAGLNHSPGEAAAIAERAVRFRNTLGAGLGRSYGAEVVGVTFDFAMASVGDATARNVIEAFDPNAKKAWRVNDKGETAMAGEKSHFDFGKWIKNAGATTWRVFSKNQGEDWFAGIAYVFQMKGQRYLLNTAFSDRFKGHSVAFDENFNGGVYKVNQAGQIVGDYQLPGAIDLHARFVGYNWYTLMFREGYDQIANSFAKWKESGFAIHPHLPAVVEHPLSSVGWLGRYVTKSFIKANLYMNPAVVPFWVMRSPQSKWRGAGGVAIHPDAANMAGSTPVADPFSWRNYDHYPTATIGDKFEKGFSQMLNPFGKAAYKAGNVVQRGADKIFTGDGSVSRFIGAAGSQERGQFVHNYVNASFSYTPYMWAKAETQLRIDERPPNGDLGKMDKAIYKLMHEAAHFRLKDVWATTKEIAKLSTHFDDDPNLQKEFDAPPSPPPGPVMPPIAQTSTPKPRTTVQADGRMRHDPITLDAANENFKMANDNTAGSAEQRATGTDDVPVGKSGSHVAAQGDAKDRAERSWAAAIADRPLNSPLFPAPPTRH